jgi:hypothetical protein
VECPLVFLNKKGAIQMGYDLGTVFVYNTQLWLFEGYSTDGEMRQTYLLRGLNGILVEALASECYFLISPTEIDDDYLRGEME